MHLDRRLQWTLVFFLAAIAILSRLNFNGLILNFDYGIFQPDGSHYTYRTLTFLGIDSNIAANRVVDWYQIHGIKNNSFAPDFLTPENKEMWKLVSPRVLYSLLSVPFVHLIGINGMMVVPILSFLILIYSIFKMSEIYNKQMTGIATVIVITTSPTILRWMIADITDSLLAGLFGVVALVLAANKSKYVWYFSIMSLILLTSLTRFCFPIWVAISFVYLINGMKAKASAIFVTSLLAFIPTLMLLPAVSFVPENSDRQEIQKLLQLPLSFIKVGFIEIAQLGALDRILLLFLIVSMFISIWSWKQLPSQLFLAVLTSVWFIGAINGTLGVNFRYQLPIIGFACWAILENLRHSPNWDSWRRINVVGKEA